MRHSRRNGHAGQEFGGSGEDSFVAVVVTKLTGALLFILLLTMVIMALIPKAIDLPQDRATADGLDAEPPAPLLVTTPESLPDAIAGRPYTLALAATGGRGPLTWSIAGALPDGLRFDPSTGRIEGSPTKGTPEPIVLQLSVGDGFSRASHSTRFVVYQSDRPLSLPSWMRPKLPVVPLRTWMEQGFGFLVIALVHVIGMGTLKGLQGSPAGHDDRSGREVRRFVLYRTSVRLASVAAAATLGAWLWSTGA